MSVCPGRGSKNGENGKEGGIGRTVRCLLDEVEDVLSKGLVGDGPCWTIFSIFERADMHEQVDAPALCSPDMV